MHSCMEYLSLILLSSTLIIHKNYSICKIFKQINAGLTFYHKQDQVPVCAQTK